MIAVSGWRGALSEEDRLKVYSVLRPYSGLTWNVGDCPTGVDAYVRERFQGENIKVYIADWEALGRRAGPERNLRMLAGATVLVAFPGPNSPGTWNAFQAAIRRGIETHVYPIGRRP